MIDDPPHLYIFLGIIFRVENKTTLLSLYHVRGKYKRFWTRKANFIDVSLRDNNINKHLLYLLLLKKLDVVKSE